MKITELDPKNVFYWFNEICRIPHGSGNTGMISDFCVDFAKERDLEYYRDSTGNVVIYKNASADRGGCEPVILQGHLDMVCDKTAECVKDMQSEGVTPVTDGEFVWADGTTLGADDGIAIAYILAVLDADDISHPPVEALFTVDEEVGLIGADALDCSCLKGRRLINIDSEEEGILTVGCAGGVRGSCEIPLDFVRSYDDSVFIKLSVSGLRGGHSGIDIDKNRRNAIAVLAALLDRVNRRFSINICSLSGGGKMNIIPHDAEAVIIAGSSDTEGILSAVDEFSLHVRSENSINEPDICIGARECGKISECADRASTDKIIFTLMQSPDGVMAMDPEIKGAVQSSLNMGTALIDEGRLSISYFVRSNSVYGKKTVSEKLAAFLGYLGGNMTYSSDYPPWEYKSDSKLRELMVDVYGKIYNSKPEILAIHAGLECGSLSAKIPGSDMISFGPDIENAHTPMERLNVMSAARCYEYLIEVLKRLD